ncbi:hypothetical protein AWR41_06345 [Riemerella anatipestifer]|nr:hypothetical protein [Riemerella anatipestifer]MSN88879.1 hypothetical protein [Riemerella anatipestifer]MSN92981.1 hypothetical protein [Riemerella anatipestifer]MSN95158.1 hypothetical protein [Riemerella anatipestifer]OBP41792.1 hypothetical protein AWR41_06345 [Riemerella anatipestifer]
MSFWLAPKGPKVQEQRLGLAPPNHSVGFAYGTGQPPAIWKLSLSIPLRGHSLNLPLLSRALIMAK